MTASPPDGQGRRAAEETAARDAALTDVLAGRYAPPPPGHARIAYHIAHSFAQGLRPQVEADVRQQRFAPPAGTVEAFLCADCGRILLYGRRNDDLS